MEQDLKTGVIVIAVCLAVGAAIGYFEAPTKTETKVEIKTVETEVIKWKEVIAEKKQDDKVTIIVETISPDGTIHRETRIVDKGTLTLDQSKESSDEKTKVSEKVVTVETESKKTDWSASALISPTDFSFTTMKYGIVVEKRIIGPFKLGAFGLTDKTFGVTIGMGF